MKFMCLLLICQHSLASLPINPGGIGGLFKGPNSEIIIKGPDGSVITAAAEGGEVLTDLETAVLATVPIVPTVIPVLEGTKELSSDLIGPSGRVTTQGSKSVVAGPASTTVTGPVVVADAIVRSSAALTSSIAQVVASVTPTIVTNGLSGVSGVTPTIAPVLEPKLNVPPEVLQSVTPNIIAPPSILINDHVELSGVLNHGLISPANIIPPEIPLGQLPPKPEVVTTPGLGVVGIESNVQRGEDPVSTITPNTAGNRVQSLGANAGINVNGIISPYVVAGNAVHGLNANGLVNLNAVDAVTRNTVHGLGTNGGVNLNGIISSNDANRVHGLSANGGVNLDGIVSPNAIAGNRVHNIGTNVGVNLNGITTSLPNQIYTGGIAPTQQVPVTNQVLNIPGSNLNGISPIAPQGLNRPTPVGGNIQRPEDHTVLAPSTPGINSQILDLNNQLTIQQAADVRLRTGLEPNLLLGQVPNSHLGNIQQSVLNQHILQNQIAGNGLLFTPNPNQRVNLAGVQQGNLGEIGISSNLGPLGVRQQQTGLDVDLARSALDASRQQQVLGGNIQLSGARHGGNEIGVSEAALRALSSVKGH